MFQQSKQRFLDAGECEKNHAVELIASLDVTKRLENSIGSQQDSIDDCLIWALELRHQFRQQIFPLLRIVQFCNDTDGFRDLRLD